MRLLALPILAAGFLAAIPASAQGWGGYSPSPAPGVPRDSGISGQLGKIRSDTNAGRRSGQLTRGEARALRRERASISTLEERFASDGLSDSEKAELQTRVEILHGNTVARRSQPRK
jgi:hypothetical protein